MKRTDSTLRAGVAFAALMMATAAQAQEHLAAARSRSRRGAAGHAERRDRPARAISSSPARVSAATRSTSMRRVVFVDQADILKTGLSSINDVLQRLPSSGGGLNSKFNNSGNLGNPPDGGGVGAGAAEIDLRYLGSRRVLVLVDGMRYVNGASASGVPGSTDLNSIPESAIERVEVLQDGASAIYGSDAIAGVVNIITKSKQAGFVGLRPIWPIWPGRRRDPELPAQLGQREQRPDPGRRGRQLRQAGPGQHRRSRPLAIPVPLRRKLQRHSRRGPGRRLLGLPAQRPLRRVRPGPDADRAGAQPALDAGRFPQLRQSGGPVQLRPVQLHPDSRSSAWAALPMCARN